MEDRGNNRTRGVYRPHREAWSTEAAAEPEGSTGHTGGGMEDRGSSKTRGVCRTVHTSKWGAFNHFTGCTVHTPSLTPKMKKSKCGALKNSA